MHPSQPSHGRPSAAVRASSQRGSRLSVRVRRAQTRSLPPADDTRPRDLDHCWQQISNRAAAGRTTQEGN